MTLVLSLSTGAWAASANEDLVCRPDVPELDLNATLRAISLDVRGRAPSPEEYALLDGQTDIPEALVDEWLASEDFVTRAVRWHRELLWTNISNVSLTSFRGGLGTSPDGIYFRNLPSTLYRGNPNTPCLNQPVQFDANGEIVATVQPDGTRREGYVNVSPYWAPTTTLKVCAFDAQDALVSPDGVQCGTSAGYSDAHCGCGPDLRWCKAGNVNAQTVSAMALDVEKRVAAMVREDRPYTELFTSRRAFVNGPLVHFYRYQTGIPDNVSVEPVSLNVATLPDLAFTDKDTWVEIELPVGHAGVLTSPAYLLRFQTNRARANRYFNAFLCQPFQPPATGIPVGDPVAMREPDLQKRHGCKYCHAMLEPAASHWGRWPQRGAGFLDETRFPETREDCALCARNGTTCSAECNAYYFTRASYDSEKPYLGLLTAYHFLRPEHLANVEQGPSYLMRSTIVDNRMPACVSRHMVEKLAGRLLLPEEEPLVTETMAREFVTSNYSFKTLIKSVVMSPVYRRVR
jgi:hypothetical protein